MHSTDSYPLYDSNALDTIIEINETSSKKKHIEEQDSPTLMSQFINSVPDCEASLKPSYLAFKIFDFVKKTKNFSKQ